MSAILSSKSSEISASANSPYRSARLACNMSIANAASKLGVSRNTLHDYELGKAFPSAIILRDMALIYRTSADDLLGLGTSP